MVELILPDSINADLSKDTGMDIIVNEVTISENFYDNPAIAAYIYTFYLTINGNRKKIWVKMPIGIDKDLLSGTNLFLPIYKALVETIKQGEK